MANEQSTTTRQGTPASHANGAHPRPDAQGGPADDPGETPRSVEIASRGISNSRQTKNFLSALVGDVMTERVPVRVANSAINGIGKLLKTHDLEERYASSSGGADKVLQLADPSHVAVIDPREAEMRALRQRLEQLENDKPIPPKG